MADLIDREALLEKLFPMRSVYDRLDYSIPAKAVWEAVLKAPAVKEGGEE